MTKQVKVYQAIVKQIIRLIKEGNFKQGYRLPSERRLAEIFQSVASSGQRGDQDPRRAGGAL